MGDMYAAIQHFCWCSMHNKCTRHLGTPSPWPFQGGASGIRKTTWRVLATRTPLDVTRPSEERLCSMVSLPGRSHTADSRWSSHIMTAGTFSPKPSSAPPATCVTIPPAVLPTLHSPPGRFLSHPHMDLQGLPLRTQIPRDRVLRDAGLGSSRRKLAGAGLRLRRRNPEELHSWWCRWLDWMRLHFPQGSSSSCRGKGHFIYLWSCCK
jgi:hypothetical protein